MLIFADGVRLPFDLAPLRGLAYHLDAAGAARPDGPRRRQGSRRAPARGARTRPPTARSSSSSPICSPDIQPTEDRRVPRSRRISSKLKERLAEARRQGVEAVREVREELGDLEQRRVGCGGRPAACRIVRSEAWPEMVALVEQMPAALAPGRPWSGSSMPWRSTAPAKARKPSGSCSTSSRAGAQQRDLRHPRAGLQGPLGGGPQGWQHDARSRSARQGDRRLLQGVRERLAGRLPRHQRGRR